MFTKHSFWMIVLAYLLLPRCVYAHSPEVIVSSALLTIILGAGVAGLVKFLLLWRRLSVVSKHVLVTLFETIILDVLLMFISLSISFGISTDKNSLELLAGGCLLYCILAVFPNLYLLREKNQRVREVLVSPKNIMNALFLASVFPVVLVPLTFTILPLLYVMFGG